LIDAAQSTGQQVERDSGGENSAEPLPRKVRKGQEGIGAIAEWRRRGQRFTGKMGKWDKGGWGSCAAMIALPDFRRQNFVDATHCVRSNLLNLRSQFSSRRHKEGKAMATIYCYDPINGQIDRELDENGNVLVEYTREPDGTLISEHRNGVSRQYHFDGQGNTLALTDDDGNVTDTFAYNASGEQTERTGTTPTPYRYHGQQGYYWDDETGDYHVQRRDLSPEESRWLSADPIGDGTNPYLYVHNNPVNQVDPSGLFASFQGDPPPGSLNAKLSRCQPEYLAKGCCCTDATIQYWPSAKDKATYNKITLVQWATTHAVNHKCFYGQFSPWHSDPPADVNYIWCKDPTSSKECHPLGLLADYTDYPGGGSVAGSQQYIFGCPGICATDTLTQLFETCAVGELPNGKEKIIGCVIWGHSCKYTYTVRAEAQPWPPAICPSMPVNTSNVWCDVSCSIKRVGRGASSPSPPQHVVIEGN
jgi:RHS repeat-associated protein